MQLTNENYFSPEMMLKYMSTSQFKSFENCEAAALAEVRNEYAKDRAVYKEGHYFEACITGNEELFLLQNPDMVSSRGATKGELKSNFKKVIGSVEAFKRQEMLMDIVSRCEKQVIVTGEIAGVPFKGCVDFLDPETLEGFDTKCMRDFKKAWSEVYEAKIGWYFAYGYNYQSAIYRELIRQTYGRAGRQYIIAATKEDVPDVAALYFSDDIVDNALGVVEEYAPRYAKIKAGLIKPKPCGICDYCKSQKVLTGFDEIMEFE